MLQLSIRRKVLLILLSGVFCTLLTVGGIYLYSFNTTRKAMEGQSTALGVFMADSMGDYTANLAKGRLKDITETKAQHLDRELRIVQMDVEFMAESLNLMLTSPDKYRPRSLPDARKEPDILFGTPYIHYSPTLLQQGIGPDLQTEIGLASNFADVLQTMSKAYRGSRTSLYAGSKNGYLLCLDLQADMSTPGSIFPSPEVREKFLTTYDPRNRTWYKQGKAAGKAVFSSVYRGAEGNLDLTCAMPYYDANGFAGVVGISYTVEDIYETLVKNAMVHIGKGFVLDDKGNVLFSSENEGVLTVTQQAKDLRQSEEAELAEAARYMTDGESRVMSVTLDGKSYYLAFAPLKTVGWSLGLLMDTSEVAAPVEQVEASVMEQVNAFQETLQATLFHTLLKGFWILIPILLLLMYASEWMAGRVTRPIRRLAEGAREIAEGNFDRKFTLTTGDEIEHLADSFNFMTDELKKYTQNLAKVAAEKERSRTELEVAAKIQMDMLPQNFADFAKYPEFAIYALMEPAKNVGGDFYDFYLLQGRYFVITVADVSGKGVPAALFMAKSQSVLKNCVLRAEHPEDMAEIISEANSELCRNNEAMMFVTLFIGVLDLHNGHFTYTNGGHCPPLLEHNGRYEFLSMKKNCVLGLAEMPYVQQSIDLQPGDTLFVYTDGVSEAMNEQNELFTEKRIQEGLNSLPAGQEVEVVLQQMLTKIRQYAGAAEQSDDITMMGLRYKGKA